MAITLRKVRDDLWDVLQFGPSEGQLLRCDNYSEGRVAQLEMDIELLIEKIDLNLENAKKKRPSSPESEPSPSSWAGSDTTSEG